MRTSKVPTAGDVLTILDAVYDVEVPSPNCPRTGLTTIPNFFATWVTISSPELR